MTVEKLVEYLLIEARKNPELNTRVSAYETLKPYSTNEDYYISFTKIDKIGINPKSHYETPLGIYTYPLSAIWSKYDVDKKMSVGKAVPFAGQQPYIWLIKPKENSNLVDMGKYTEQDFKNDKEKLLKHIQNNKEEYALTDMSVNSINDMFDSWSNSATRSTPICKMWNITRKLSMGRNGKKTTQWNVLLRKVLGYSGFVDRTSLGYIHESEPVQAVFLSRSAFTVVKQVLNKDYEKLKPKPEEKNHPVWLFRAQKDGGLIEMKDGVVHWRGGIWIQGIWHDGIWHNGSWHNGVWKKGTWMNGNFNGGNFNGGNFNGGNFNGGDFNGGNFNGGVWYDGNWKGGTWKSGYIYDPKKKGNYKSKSRFSGGFVESPVNPEEFWKGVQR